MQRASTDNMLRMSDTCRCASAFLPCFMSIFVKMSSRGSIFGGIASRGYDRLAATRSGVCAEGELAGVVPNGWDEEDRERLRIRAPKPDSPVGAGVACSAGGMVKREDEANARMDPVQLRNGNLSDIVVSTDRSSENTGEELS